jgi:hypothetical protein
MTAASTPKTELTVFTFEDLRGRYEARTARVIAECELATELVGGQNASEDGIRAYVRHHLGLVDEEAETAVQRILREELGERDVPSETGELQEKMVYGINVIRRDSFGPWLGNWMAKACLKAAASRIGLFTQKRGSKGDMAEMGEIRPFGPSLSAMENLTGEDARYGVHQRIHLIAPDSDGPVQTYYKEFKGSVSTPKGRQSIVNTAECAPPGTRLAFEFRYAEDKVKEDDIAEVFAIAMNIGLGSCKSFECGKFIIRRLSLEHAAKLRTITERTSDLNSHPASIQQKRIKR